MLGSSKIYADAALKGRTMNEIDEIKAISQIPWLNTEAMEAAIDGDAEDGLAWKVFHSPAKPFAEIWNLTRQMQIRSVYELIPGKIQHSLVEKVGIVVLGRFRRLVAKAVGKKPPE